MSAMEDLAFAAPYRFCIEQTAATFRLRFLLLWFIWGSNLNCRVIHLCRILPLLNPLELGLFLSSLLCLFGGVNFLSKRRCAYLHA